MRAASLASVAILALTALPIAAQEEPVADDVGTQACINSHVWFLGVVYDANDNPPRNDFIIDLDNFVFYREELRKIYCISDAQEEILAFRGGFVRNGVTYPAATEAAARAKIAEFGAAASAFPDSIFFLFISSHGNFYSANVNCPGIRGPGSFSALQSGGGQDGSLRDCELGAALNAAFNPAVKMAVFVDCSFCGGFSDSLTAASGTLPDDNIPAGAGVVKPNRIVMTGCAITTECFGSDGGGVSYKHLKAVWRKGVAWNDGYTAPGFPAVQGVDYGVKSPQFNAPNGVVGMSEMFFSAVDDVYKTFDVIGIQQQFRIKYGFPSLADDIRVA